MSAIGRNDLCWCGSGQEYKRCHWPAPEPSVAPGHSYGPDSGAEFSVMQRSENQSVFYLGGSDEDAEWISGGFVEVAGARLWKPTLLAETVFRSEAEEHLRERFSEGQLTTRNEINAAIHWQSSWMSEVIDAALLEVGDLRLLDFFVFQHDQWTVVFQTTMKMRCQPTQLSSREEWVLDSAPLARRALKYLIERFIQIVPIREDSGANDEQTMSKAERALVFGEEYFRHTALSDQTYYLFPEQTAMTVHAPGEQYFWSLTLDDSINELVEAGKERIARWQRADLDYSNNLGTMEAVQVLDQPMAASLGFSMSDAIRVLRSLAIGAEPAGGAFRAYVRYDDAVVALASNCNLPPDRIELVLAGWLLSRQLLDDEVRDPLKPNQRIRMLTRPLLYLGEDSRGPYMMVPREFLAEAVAMALERVMRWKELPTPWHEASDETVTYAIEQQAQSKQKEFESITADLLSGIGFVGCTVACKTLSPWGFELPDGMGDIDYLGINLLTRMMVVGECKHITGATDPVRWRDERDDFLRPKTGYVPKLKAKFEHVVQHAPHAITAIAAKEGLDVTPGDWTVIPIVITAGEHLIGPFCQQHGVSASSLQLLLEDLPAQAEDATWPHSEVVVSRRC